MPCQKREVLFARGELTRGILDTLRDVGRPMTSRKLVQSVLSLSGPDARDRKLMAEHARRVFKALRGLLQNRAVRRTNDDHGNQIWQI